ncbi:hypothetical protein MUY35_14590 [Aliiroseovarius sp. S1339]|uniref:hypothetical protein n=1 Tax=Aliiroseovarius sp. S1339 TaxID=2936990 RepID=UPI0020C11C5B|nr:hypothetical protein [Aliiroseovarius sp. S1339]MCK8465083.1 hypothetical protein [Aliiroseovarius sp. S1339]
MPATPNVYWTCAKSTWNPVIGDPTALGWLTTGLLCVAAYLSLRCARSPVFTGTERRFERWFWLSTAVFLVLLTLNKQLDLQTYLLAAGRCIARAQGWYGARRGVQLVASVIVTGMVGVWVVWIVIGLRRSLAHMWLELSGVVALGLFFGLRLFTVFHVVDDVSLDAASRLLEMAGPILLIVAVWQVWRLHGQLPSLHR